MGRFNLTVEPRMLLELQNLSARAGREPGGLQRGSDVGLHRAAVERSRERGRAERLQGGIEIDPQERRKTRNVVAREIELEIVELQGRAEPGNRSAEPSRRSGDFFKGRRANIEPA